MPTVATSSLPSLLALNLALVAAAQCTPAAAPDGSVPGLRGAVRTMHTWDPDGVGPAHPLTAFGGSFVAAGPWAVQGIAAHEEATDSWLLLGGSSNGDVRAFATLPTGELVAAGDFTSIGGVAASYIATWNGVAWAPLGSGTNGPVHCLQVDGTGTLLVGGAFTAAGAGPANRIARWSPAAGWASGLSAAGVGFNNTVFALQVMPNGHVYAGGQFTALSPGGSMNRIARWNGSSWVALSGFVFTGANNTVRALAALPNGDLVAGGDFTQLAGQSANGVALWSGSSTVALGSGLGPLLVGSCSALAVGPGGELYVGGDFTSAGGLATEDIARWSNGAWSTLAAGTDGAVAAILVTPAGTLLAAGDFPTSSPTSYWGAARWQQGSWTALAPYRGANNTVSALQRMPDGQLVAGGWFQMLNNTVAPGVARWDGYSWHPIGQLSGTVTALTVLPNGELIAAGAFAVAPGQTSYFQVASWDGVSWTHLGGADGIILALAALPDGTLVAGGAFNTMGGVNCQRIARRVGATWLPLGSGVGGTVLCLEPLTNGTLAVGGQFGSTGGLPNAAFGLWNGSNWLLNSTQLTGGTVHAICELPSGDLMIAGQGLFAAQAFDKVALRSGGQWLPLVTGPASGGAVHALWRSHGGDVYAVGTFSQLSGTPAANLARWDGVQWQQVGPGLDGPGDCIETHGNSLVLGGSFTAAGTTVARRIAWFPSPCEPSSSSVGAGCIGTNGPDLLRELTPAWLGDTFRAEATGLPVFGLSIAVAGAAQIGLPLTAVFAHALPTCVLHCSPDVLGLYPINNGTLATEYAVPLVPQLIGAAYYHQCVSIGLDTQLEATEVTATNALMVRLGLY